MASTPGCQKRAMVRVKRRLSLPPGIGKRASSADASSAEFEPLGGARLVIGVAVKMVISPSYARTKRIRAMAEYPPARESKDALRCIGCMRPKPSAR